ncbi:hypothetical protein F5Y16DRAFT_405829 [Xylariaceae sp. FL0255]|nr:hypothetical protein F5Y16DRAFT_405829 [Xylariaceae sp. FL0255]
MSASSQISSIAAYIAALPAPPAGQIAQLPSFADIKNHFNNNEEDNDIVMADVEDDNSSHSSHEMVVITESPQSVQFDLGKSNSSNTTDNPSSITLEEAKKALLAQRASTASATKQDDIFQSRVINTLGALRNQNVKSITMEGEKIQIIFKDC